jgi:hypothetical protein
MFTQKVQHVLRRVGGDRDGHGEILAEIEGVLVDGRRQRSLVRLVGRPQLIALGHGQVDAGHHAESGADRERGGQAQAAADGDRARARRHPVRCRFDVRLQLRPGRRRLRAPLHIR